MTNTALRGTEFGVAQRLLVATAVVALGAMVALVLIGALPPITLLIPIGLAGAAALVALAVVRFEAFILTLLVIRSSLDLAKSAGSGTSATDPASLIAFLMIGASVGWLLLQGRGSRRWPPSPLSLGLVLFTAAVGVSVIGSAQLGFSGAAFVRIVGGVLMYFVVDRLLAEGMPVKRLLVALFASTLVPVLLPVIGRFAGISFSRTKDGVEALASTFFLSNNFAHFLVPFLLVGFALLWQISRTRGRIIAGAFLLLGFAELVMTNTRGAWLAFVVGAVIVGFVQNKAALIGLIVGTALVVAFVPTVNQRLADLGSNPDQPRAESSWSWRLNHWEAIIPLADENPVTGIGIGMTVKEVENRKEPHNDYLRAYVETGFVGLAAYLLTVGGFLWVSFRARRQARNDFEAALALGIFAFAVAFAASSLAENLITGIVWLWYALPFAAIANWIAYRDDSAGSDTRPEGPVSSDARVKASS